MKFIRLNITTAAFLFFATMTPIYAQHDGQGDKQGKSEGQGKGGQQQPQRAQQPQQQQQQPQRAQQPQQQAQQQQPRPAQYQEQQRAPQQQPQRTQEQARAWQQQRGWAQQGGAWQGHDSWQQDRAQHWSSDHRTWAQRGGYGGYYIPQQTFGLYFGSQHFFRIRSRPTMYMGYPRFEYGGFSFLLVDPWPEYWADNWYDTDDLYVDYDDGYYLYNRMHPGAGLAITIVL